MPIELNVLETSVDVARPRKAAAVRRVGALLAACVALFLSPSIAAAGQWMPSFALPGPADRSAGFDAAAGPDGTVVVAWTKTTTGDRSQVMASVRPPGGEFSTPQPLGAPEGASPEVAVDGRGTAIVVWEQRVGNTVLHTIEQSTRPAGGSFGVPQDLSAFTDEARFPDVATNRRGDALVTWTNRITSPNFIEAVGRPAGGSFSTHLRVSGPVGTTDAVDSQVAVGEDGSGMVTWEREDGRAQAAPWSASLNSFGSAFDVTAGSPSEFGAAPDVAVTPAGAAVFAYFGTVNGANPAIKTKTRTNGVLGAATNIATLPTFNGRPSLVSNAAGDMLAAWNSGSAFMRAAFRPAGAQSFQAAETLSGSLSAAFSAPSTALTAGGDAVVAWVAGSAGSQRVQARTRPRSGPFSAIQDDFPTRAAISDVTAFADGEGNVGTVSRRTGTGDAGTLELRPFDGAPPRATGLALPSDAVERRPAAFAASFLDTWSPFSVAWSFGDGGTAAGSRAEHGYAGAGAFAVSATATDAAGNQVTQRGTTGVRALRPDEIDADRDGFASDKDCNDGNPAIHPGALEIRGNAVDENCDKVREPFPRVAANASLATLFGRGFTQLSTLKVSGLERGDAVKLSCTGRGCRRSLKATLQIKRRTRLLDLSKRVAGVRLRKRARLDVRISHPGFITHILRFTVVRFGAVPRRTELCQPPGAARPATC
jgi:hypothetical protein